MKTVLVTGAAGGMGTAICRKLSSEGMRVFALDIREVSVPGVESIFCDLTDEKSVEQVQARISAVCSRLDYIVHAAGIYDLDALTEMEDQQFRRIFEINLFGVYRINRIFAPLLSEDGRVTIITSELAPLNPLPFTGIYAVTKGALEKYAYSLRTELSLRGIRVSIVRPGAVQTGLLNVSTRALDRFVNKTVFFKPNARRFYQIVSRVEARAVLPERVAELVWRSLSRKHPKYVYNLNRNILLRLLSAMPDHFQLWILKLILR